MLYKIVTAVLSLSSISPLVAGDYCSGSPEPGYRTNDYPIFDTDVTFVRSVPNASLFEAGPSNARFPIVHVYGNAYEVGYANGLLQKDYMKGFVDQVYEYFVGMALDALGDKVSPAVQAMIIMHGLNHALDWAAEVTAPFTPQEFYDEIQGMADATGIHYQTILRLNMYPELTKAMCSFFGAWGEATAEGTGHSYQLRALDFDTEGPFKDFPQITVYHPSDGKQPFANVGWPGFVGMLSGTNAAQMALSEIGVYFSDDSFGQGNPPETPPEKVKGEPWAFVLRDVMKYENTLDDAITRIEESNRTCNLIIGIGDGKSGLVNGIEYSGYVAIPYNDTTLLPVNETWHPQIPGVVYNGMDWLCPNYDIALAEQLQRFHGSIDEVNTIHDTLPTVQTGNLHIAVYDLTESTMHISFMRKSTADPSEPEFAYERQFSRLHMDQIFALQAPHHY